MIFKINGVDFVPYLSDTKPVVWKRNDVDSSDAGEMDDGTVRRDRVIMRPTVDVTIKPRTPLLDADIAKLQEALNPEWVTLEAFDPYKGKVVTEKYYSNNISLTIAAVIDGVAIWNGFTFPLIAQGVSGEA